jgi:multimeric flavodoxin WrbA
MQILAINGSPRKRGHTVELLEVALGAARERGAQTHLIHLADYDIRRCRGCYTCAKSSCPLQDDMPRLLADIRTYHAQGLLYGAPVFNFNLPGLLIDFWNRKTGLSGYHKARETASQDEWLEQNRARKVGAALVQAGHSGGQKTVLKHINFALLSEAERVLPGLAAHTRNWDYAQRDAARLGRRMVEALGAGAEPYPLWQMPLIYKRRTWFEVPRS